MWKRTTSNSLPGHIAPYPMPVRYEMMTRLPLHGWSRGDLLALAGVATAVIVAVVPPLRRFLVQRWRAGLMRAGFPRRRYARWFVRHWGVYENPYLEDTEDLDLRSTYVSLSFHSDDDDLETRAIATAVLADRSAGSLVIQGAPGSGKSTLLKAFGVGACQARLGWRRQGPDETPFLVQLRKLAKALDRKSPVVSYLIDDILVSGVGMSHLQASQFLRSALIHDHVLVMLDGLDEVRGDRYRAVLEAVNEFINDHHPDHPTYLARVIVTCRRQNFLAIRDEWLPAIAQRLCTLAPLRNSEIFSYLDKLRAKFRASGGPEAFMQAVRASGSLDLHRAPLVLAMSVGLYARKDFFEIPASIARLYRLMIEEMLDRHRFKRDPGGATLVFKLDDKYRYLREFALYAARKASAFDEFTEADMTEYGTLLAPHLDAVRDPSVFVQEIIRSSGLLSEVTDERRYVFAHRSIQEYLAAEELLVAADGARFLLDHAVDAEWRQVTVFYATALEQRRVDTYLSVLAQRNLPLAAYCLGSAKATNGVASSILAALEPTDGLHLAALAAATTSPRVPIQELAIQKLEQSLSSPSATAITAISGEIDGMLPLLGSLAGTNAARIASLVPGIIEQIPDDPRLVEPLWRCLAAPGIEEFPACRTIVQRLLALAIEPDGLDELSRQDRYAREFLTPAIRHTAYPFLNGHDATHNLVTLLSWAEYIHVVPIETNRFFEAKGAGRLASVEADRSRTVVFSLFRPAGLLSIIGPIAAAGSAIWVLAADDAQLLRPFGYWTLLVMLMAVLVPMVIIFGLAFWAERSPAHSRFNRLFAINAPRNDTAIWMMTSALQRIPDLLEISIIIVVIPAAYGIAAAPLMAYSVAGYFATVGLGMLLYLVPWLDMCSRDRRYYLYRPNPYIDIYEDTRSRHWVSKDSRLDDGGGQTTARISRGRGRLVPF